MTLPQLAYFWGEDAFGIEHAAETYAAELAQAAGQPLDVWRTSADEEGKASGRLSDEIAQRTASGTLFSAGTVAIVRQPAGLLKDAAGRERLIGLLDGVAPGNALSFVDLIASGAKGPAQGGALRDAVSERGGLVREYPALSRERMEAWINARAKELNVTLGPGAANLIAERVGAFVRERDVDRRRQTELANGELAKLALYRPDAPVTTADVESLVTEAVPGSTWAFLDAVGSRRAAEAATLAGRLLSEAAPMPVLISVLHRRLRDLIAIRDHLEAGTKPPDIVREMKLQSYRAQKLTEQARTWQPHELDAALHDLYRLDLLSKGIAADGSPHSMSDGKSALALLAWIGEHVGRAGGGARPTASGRSAPVGTRR